MKALLTIFLLVLTSSLFAQDTSFIKVHFIYGSKPLKKYKTSEKKWFGGLNGGHVGIETDSTHYLSFEGKGKFHWFSHRNKRNSIYKSLPAKEFWDIMEYPGDSTQRLTVIIPVSSTQKRKLDSIATSYITHTPYDYSLFGMRCASSTYELLAQLGLLKEYSFTGTALKIFYPRKIRKRLVTTAAKNGWTMIAQEGTTRRKWEKDWGKKNKETLSNPLNPANP
jgi:hypothetical protein